MNWTWFIAVVALAVLYIAYKNSGTDSQERCGRPAEEGRDGDRRAHARGIQFRPSVAGIQHALDEVEDLVLRQVKDKDKVLLLHCQSGVRSKTAKERLESMGYKNVFNMGSYERAFKIVTGRSL